MKSGQHRTIASASLRRLFAPLLQFEKREIHTVFLRFPSFELGQKSCLRLLAELRGAAFKSGFPAAFCRGKFFGILKEKTEKFCGISEQAVVE